MKKTKFIWLAAIAMLASCTSNFTAIGENKFALDVTLAENVVTTITDYYQYVNSFIVTTDGSKVVSMSVETRNKSVEAEVFEYAYIVSEH